MYPKLIRKKKRNKVSKKLKFEFSELPIIKQEEHFPNVHHDLIGKDSPDLDIHQEVGENLGVSGKE